MTVIFLILIILASVILALIVLVQNPKGGGLAGNIAGFSNQFMGVKQTTDVLERGTWLFAGIIGALCLVSTFFIPKTITTGHDETKKELSSPLSTPTQQNPANTIQLTPNKPTAKP